MERKNSRFIVSMVCVILLSVAPLFAFATSWVLLSAEELVERAEVVVEGKYIFPDGENVKNAEGMWVPLTFEATAYYRGSGQQHIKAAIEQFDIGLAYEHQENGGSFILFLEQGDSDFWIPVGGPNGMIEIMDDNILGRSNDSDTAKIKEFIEQQSSVMPEVSTEEPNAGEMNTAIWYGGIAVIFIAGFIIYFCKYRKK